MQKGEAHILCIKYQKSQLLLLLYTCKRLSVNYTVSYTQREQACKPTVCLSPSLLPQTHAHTETHTVLGRADPLCVVKAEGGLLVDKRHAIFQDDSKGWWCTLRDRRQTLVYTTHGAHQTWCCSCHLSEVAMKKMRLTALEYDVGAKPRTNGKTCDIPKSFLKVLFFMKNISKNMHSECLQIL